MRCGRPRVASLSLRHGLLLSDARPPGDLRVVHRCPGDRGVALLLILISLLLAGLAMPHRWSPAKLAARRDLARIHGYLRSCPKGHSHVLAPDCVAERVKGVTRGLLATRELERASGLHRRSGADLAVAARPLVGDAMTDAFISENQRYCGHKHRKFAPTDPELEYKHVLPPSRKWCDLSEEVHDADLELDLEEKCPDLPLHSDSVLVMKERVLNAPVVRLLAPVPVFEHDPVHDLEHELVHDFALEHERVLDPPPSPWPTTACPRCCWLQSLAGQHQAIICSMSSLIEGQNNTIAILCAWADSASSCPAAPLPHNDIATVLDNISNTIEELALRITNLEARGGVQLPADGLSDQFSNLDATVLGLSVAVASQKKDIAEAEEDISRTATLVKDIAASLDTKLTELTAKTMPLLCDKVFEKAAKLFVMIDGRIKTLEASTRAPAIPAHDVWLAERFAGLDSRLLDLESSLLGPLGDSMDIGTPPTVAAEATRDTETFHCGQYVRLSGLSAEHLNGTIGYIVGFDDKTSRYKVQYAGKPPVGIKGLNLEVASCPKCYLVMNSDMLRMRGWRLLIFRIFRGQSNCPACEWARKTVLANRSFPYSRAAVRWTCRCKIRACICKGSA